MILKYEQVSVSNAVKTLADLSPPKNGAGGILATHVMLQADSAGHVRFTMDNATDPTTGSGMLLLTTEPPCTYLIEDLIRIRFIRNGGTDTKLNLQYFAGRNV